MSDGLKAFEVGSEERVLFVFTHPDDEVSLVAFIGRLKKQGVPVHAVWTHSTDVRESESRRAMSLLGFDASSLLFFGGKDGETMYEIDSLRDRLSPIIAEFKPTRVVTHAFEQGHLDHDTTNLLVNICYNGPVFEAPFYHTYLDRFPVIYRFSCRDEVEVIELSDTEIALKWSVLKCYPSQTILRNIRLYEFARSIGVRRENLLTTERLRRQTHFDYRRPNHPVEKANKIEASDKWRRWLQAVEQYL